MKNVLPILFFLLCTTPFWAQPSSLINLQAVARTTNGVPLANKTVTLRVSLLEGSETGTPVWVESSPITTNTFGLFNYAIGSGTAQGAYTYTNVNWATKKFVKLEIDPTGGLSFITISTEELKSVPFANVAKTALFLNLPIDQVVDNTTATGLTIRSNSSNGLAGVTTKKDYNGVFGWFEGDANNLAGAGVYGQANKNGAGVYGRNVDKGSFGLIGTPSNSGYFSGAPVTIDNRTTGVSLQLAGATNTFMEFYPSQTANPATRRGYIGYPVSNGTSMFITNEFPNGWIGYQCGTGGAHQFINGGIETVNGFITAKGGGSAWNALGIDANNAGVEIHSSGTGLPYIDFARDKDRDFDMRLGLEATNLLALSGGQLRIAGSIPQNMPGFAYYAKNANDNGTRTGAGTGNYPISLYATQVIAAAEFYAFSDKRIKKDFQLSQNDKDLAALSKLEVTDYRHIDFVTKGDAYKKGFIAQQVEQVYPEAVSKSTDFIPNIYQPAAKASVQNEILRIDMAAAHGLVKGDKVRIYVKDKMHELDIADTEGSSFMIKNWKNGEAQDVFIYGKQVNDFRAVDYDRIFTLNVSATQELIKRNADLTKRVAELEQQNQGFEKDLKNLEGKVGNILKRLDTEGVSTTAQVNLNSSTPKTVNNEK